METINPKDKVRSMLMADFADREKKRDRRDEREERKKKMEGIPDNKGERYLGQKEINWFERLFVAVTFAEEGLYEEAKKILHDHKK